MTNTTLTRTHWLAKAADAELDLARFLAEAENAAPQDRANALANAASRRIWIERYRANAAATPSNAPAATAPATALSTDPLDALIAAAVQASVTAAFAAPADAVAKQPAVPAPAPFQPTGRKAAEALGDQVARDAGLLDYGAGSLEIGTIIGADALGDQIARDAGLMRPPIADRTINPAGSADEARTAAEQMGAQVARDAGLM